MGMGSATGKDKATVAADMAISSPLLETSIDGAKVLLSTSQHLPMLVLMISMPHQQ